MSKPLPLRLRFVFNRTREILENRFGFFLGAAILLAFFDRSSRDLLLILALGVAASMAATFAGLHYDAPMVVAILAMEFRALWRLRRFSWRGRPIGPYLTAAILACIYLNSAFHAGMSVLQSLTFGPSHRHSIADRLTALPGEHLVFVRYAPEHSLHVGWVTNGADLYSAPILWAHDLGPAEDEKLIRMYPNRHVWLVEPDETPPALRPYSR